MKRNLILTALVLLSLHCSAQYAWKNFNTSNSGMLSNNMSSLWVTKDNVLWAAYVGVGGNGLGVVKYDGKTWTNFDTTNSGLPNNDIRAITSDQQGNVWFGCYNAGLVKYDGTAWTLFTEANSELPHNNVTTLTVDATGHLWVGMYFGGVSEFDGTTWTHFNHSNAPFPDTNCINDILVDKNMTLWVGMDCQGGLARRDTNGTWTSYTAENSLIPNHTVTAIHAGVDHEVWLGFLTKQVSWFDGTTFTNYTLPAGVAFDGFSQDIRGNWWCGTTTAGLFRFDAGESPGPWEAENIPGTVSNVSIFSQSVGIGPDGEVWWGEQNNGLWKRERTGPYAWIPDANFRSCLKEAHPFAFTDADSLILAETPNITLIDCANRSITDLTGVEHFTDLISLLVDQNPLTTIPSLSGLSHLVSLTCRQTGMTTLPDLSGCHELMVLIAGSNHLSAFPDLTANPKLQSLDFGDNNIPAVPDLSHLPELQWLFLSNNPITILSDLSPNDKLKALLIGGLQITEAPDLSALHNLETIDINDNNLTVFPAVNNTSLKVVIAYDNDFTELPDFSNMLHSVPGSQMVLHNNRLTFEDLLPLTDLEFDVLYISEQKQPDPDRTVTASLHQAFTLVLPYDDEVTSSVYEWYKDGSLLTMTTTNRLMLENVSEGDAGVYRARITNANIPDLILESGAVTLITKVMDDLVISPDNDGVLDNYTIPFQGMVKIYNRAGALVNQFAAPALWDGTDSSGNPLPMGVYIMVCPGYKEIAITVIR